MRIWLFTFLFLTIIYSCKKDLSPLSGCTDPVALNYNPYAITNNEDCVYFSTTPYIIPSISGFPDMNIPTNNPLTIEGVALGKKLFNDPDYLKWMFSYSKN